MLKKSVSLVVALVMVFGAFGVVNAQTPTIESLQAMIAQLTAQLAGLSGTTATTASTATNFTQTLSVGSRGAEVSALQNFLNTNIAAGLPVTGYYGAMTKVAVIKFQTANGISGTGTVGPITRAKLNELTTPVVVTPVEPGTTTTPDTTTTSTLEGTDGTISDTSKLTSYNDEEVGDGEENVKVLGMEVEASNDGDIALKSVKVSFENVTGGTSSTHLDDYVSSVSIYKGDTKVGSADVDDFSEDNDVYTKTVTLDSGVVVKSDTTEKFYVVVDAVSNFDSGDVDAEDWEVTVETVRFADGSGVVTTEDVDITADIDFVDYSTAADTNLKVSLDSSSPDEGVITIDENNSTDNVVLLKGKIKVEGTSDVTIDELPITLDTTSTATDTWEIASDITLKIGDEEFTETATDTIAFDLDGYKIDAGDTVEFTVYAEINAAEDIGEGVDLKASVDNVDSIDAENEEGDSLADDETSGSALGEYQEFRSEGVAFTLVGDPTITTVTMGDYASTSEMTAIFKIKMTPTEDMTEPTAGNFDVLAYTTAGATTSPSVTISLSPDNTNNTVTADDSVTVTVKASLYSTTAGVANADYYFKVDGITYTMDGVTTTQTLGLEDYKTDQEHFKK